MYQLLLEKLDANSHSMDDPKFNHYSSELYNIFLEGEWKTFRPIFPESFRQLQHDLNAAFNHMENSVPDNSIDISLDMKHLSAIIEQYDNLKTILSNYHQYASLFIQMILFQKICLLGIISIQNKKLTYQSQDVLNFLDKKIRFSQSFIAKEWEVDNDTLSKWFEIQYGTNIFANRKKIKLSEYISIFKDLFILEEHMTDSTSGHLIEADLMDFYNSLALKGKTYSKKDIIEECFNPEEKLSTHQYEQARIALEKRFSFYSHVNKYPVSIAFQMISELKKIC
ncbi:hypothetical protein [Chryseobacterium viscerum]|uniref:Uncharacterized protein n=1 Tax=Chryseobacterium viscerum TaxID=1037377 RepID=A0A316WGG8_9FLAO|nr:hypothetical protein [Chryseobacterium viscerum]PWN58128.1 hypothetical protein C1634_024450 [Chryseobacterium viscerum]